MQSAQSIIDRIRRRFEGCDTVGMKRSEFDILAAEIEAKTPEAFGLTEHVRERQTINMLHSTCEKVKREGRGVI